MIENSKSKAIVAEDNGESTVWKAEGEPQCQISSIAAELRRRPLRSLIGTKDLALSNGFFPQSRIQVLVTGATGYIGGRLVPRLLGAGYSVRCFAREPRKLAARPWAGHAHVQIVQGDAANENAVVDAMRGCLAAYYLIHSMEAAGSDYRDRDRHLAEVFASAASRANVQRIIYLV